jgi:hypothetical protein
MAAQESDAATRRAAPSNAADYAMGSSDRERERLMRQGAVLRRFLTSAFAPRELCRACACSISVAASETSR